MRLILAMCLAGGALSAVACGFPIDPASNTPASQVWVLTATSGNQVQTAEVVLPAFENSGAFEETSDSPGWWMYDTQGNRSCRLPVGGNVVHDSPGDRWSFVGMSCQGAGMSTLGSNSSGTANGNFPDADSITNGVVTLTTTSPLGTVSGVVNWTGRRR